MELWVGYARMYEHTQGIEEQTKISTSGKENIKLAVKL
jgi:hypothetical protein